MKKIILIMIAIASTFSLQAQTSGGPDVYGNIWRDSNDPNGPSFNWIDITNSPNTVEISGLADDNIVGPFFLPSPFQFYWYTVDRFWIGSNGYLIFQNASFAHPFPIIPTPDPTKNNFLGAMMTDLTFDKTGPAVGNPASCYYWTSTAQDSVIITWDSVPFWKSGTPSYTGENTFQIIMNYADSTITFQYLTQTGVSVSTTSFVSVGIENVSGNDGLMWNQNLYPPVQYAIKFYPPAVTTQQITDVGTSFAGNPETAALFISKNAAGAYVLNSEVVNTGNTVVAPFNVSGLVRDSPGNNVMVSNTTLTDTLQPGQSQLLNMANPFIPINSGTFRFINTTTLSGDLTASNNIKTQELQVVDTTLNEILLAYDNGVAAATGISWNGGDGGCANYFIPPFYPCDISKVATLIVADPNAVGSTMKVYADDGPNKLPGTLLDSIFVASGTFTTGVYSTSVLNQLVRIDSGGFYVLWGMGGDGVSLGQDQVAPFSNRTFEVLGGTPSEYRYRDIEDLMIRATIQRVGVGINEETAAEGIGQFYPNPASDKAFINIDASLIKSDELFVQLFDIQGKLVAGERFTVQNGQLEVSLSQLETGIYTARFSTGKSEYSRKLNVVK
ncbi:MAG: T9SS type A sorting domain-containing protein [Bacteroidetes bacterium]|nr:T9SS type A sorting domain-containing protein [Bacteroidota bacterium]